MDNRVVGIILVIIGAILIGLSFGYLSPSAGGSLGLPWAMGLLGLLTAAVGAYVAFWGRGKWQ